MEVCCLLDFSALFLQLVIDEKPLIFFQLFLAQGRDDPAFYVGSTDRGVLCPHVALGHCRKFGTFQAQCSCDQHNGQPIQAAPELSLGVCG
jgi:hypothetical protein